jgi:hypothetical protein
MNFVEIIENERKPRLTGGRRGAATLQPGNNAVDRNLVPTDQLPASAGSLADVFNKIGKIGLPAPIRIPKPRKSGGASLEAVLKNPSEHQADFNQILAVAKKTSGGKRGRPKKGGAVAIGKDGKYIYSGSDDPKWLKKYGGAAYIDKDGHVRDTGNFNMRGDLNKNNDDNFWSRMLPKKGGAYLGPDGKVHTGTKGLLGATRGGKMSKLVPRHGHGAYTSIGTNYQLGQFGGAIQPIGNTASTLSPALSGMSVGAGRKCGGKRPKGKNLKKFIALMVKGRKHCCGSGFFDDAWGSIKDIARGLYHEFGPEIFAAGKDVLLKALEEGAKHYITGGEMVGGSFWNDVLDGLKSFGTWLWDSLKEFLNSEIVKEIEHEVLSMGVDMAKTYVMGKISSGAAPPTGGSLSNAQINQMVTGAGLRPGQDGHGIYNPHKYDLKKWENQSKLMGGDFGDDIKKILDTFNVYLGNFNNGRPPTIKVVNDFFNSVDLKPLNISSKELENIKERILRATMKGGNERKAVRKVGGKKCRLKGGDNNEDYQECADEISQWRGSHPGQDATAFIQSLSGKYNQDLLNYFIQGLQPWKPKPITYDDQRGPSWRPDNYTGSGRKPSARGAIVKKIMKEKGLSLPMASKYVKEHGLY